MGAEEELIKTAIDIAARRRETLGNSESIGNVKEWLPFHLILEAFREVCKGLDVDEETESRCYHALLRMDAETEDNFTWWEKVGRLSHYLKKKQNGDRMNGSISTADQSNSVSVRRDDSYRSNNGQEYASMSDNRARLFFNYHNAVQNRSRASAASPDRLPTVYSPNGGHVEHRASVTSPGTLAEGETLSLLLNNQKLSPTKVVHKDHKTIVTGHNRSDLTASNYSKYSELGSVSNGYGNSVHFAESSSHREGISSTRTNYNAYRGEDSRHSRGPVGNKQYTIETVRNSYAVEPDHAEVSETLEGSSPDRFLQSIMNKNKWKRRIHFDEKTRNEREAANFTRQNEWVGSPLNASAIYATVTPGSQVPIDRRDGRRIDGEGAVSVTKEYLGSAENKGIDYHDQRKEIEDGDQSLKMIDLAVSPPYPPDNEVLTPTNITRIPIVGDTPYLLNDISHLKFSSTSPQHHFDRHGFSETGDRKGNAPLSNDLTSAKVSQSEAASRSSLPTSVAKYSQLLSSSIAMAKYANRRSNEEQSICDSDSKIDAIDRTGAAVNTGNSVLTSKSFATGGSTKADTSSSRHRVPSSSKAVQETTSGTFDERLSNINNFLNDRKSTDHSSSKNQKAENTLRDNRSKTDSRIASPVKSATNSINRELNANENTSNEVSKPHKNYDYKGRRINEELPSIDEDGQSTGSSAGNNDNDNHLTNQRMHTSIGNQGTRNTGRGQSDSADLIDGDEPARGVISKSDKSQLTIDSELSTEHNVEKDAFPRQFTVYSDSKSKKGLSPNLIPRDRSVGRDSTSPHIRNSQMRQSFPFSPSKISPLTSPGKSPFQRTSPLFGMSPEKLGVFRDQYTGQINIDALEVVPPEELYMANVNDDLSMTESQGKSVSSAYVSTVTSSTKILLLFQQWITRQSENYGMLDDTRCISAVLHYHLEAQSDFVASLFGMEQWLRAKMKELVRAAVLSDLFRRWGYAVGVNATAREHCQRNHQRIALNQLIVHAYRNRRRRRNYLHAVAMMLKASPDLCKSSKRSLSSSKLSDGLDIGTMLRKFSSRDSFDEDRYSIGNSTFKSSGILKEQSLPTAPDMSLERIIHNKSYFLLSTKYSIPIQYYVAAQDSVHLLLCFKRLVYKTLHLPKYKKIKNANFVNYKKLAIGSWKKHYDYQLSVDNNIYNSIKLASEQRISRLKLVNGFQQFRVFMSHSRSYKGMLSHYKEKMYKHPVSIRALYMMQKPVVVRTFFLWKKYYEANASPVFLRVVSLRHWEKSCARIFMRRWIRSREFKQQQRKQTTSLSPDMIHFINMNRHKYTSSAIDSRYNSYNSVTRNSYGVYSDNVSIHITKYDLKRIPEYMNLRRAFQRLLRFAKCVRIFYSTTELQFAKSLGMKTNYSDKPVHSIYSNSNSPIKSPGKRLNTSYDYRSVQNETIARINYRSQYIHVLNHCSVRLIPKATKVAISHTNSSNETQKVYKLIQSYNTGHPKEPHSKYLQYLHSHRESDEVIEQHQSAHLIKFAIRTYFDFQFHEHGQSIASRSSKREDTEFLDLLPDNIMDRIGRHLSLFIVPTTPVATTSEKMELSSNYQISYGYSLPVLQSMVRFWRRVAAKSKRKAYLFHHIQNKTVARNLQQVFQTWYKSLRQSNHLRKTLEQKYFRQVHKFMPSQRFIRRSYHCTKLFVCRKAIRYMLWANDRVNNTKHYIDARIAYKILYGNGSSSSSNEYTRKLLAYLSRAVVGHSTIGQHNQHPIHHFSGSHPYSSVTRILQEDSIGATSTMIVPIAIQKFVTSQHMYSVLSDYYNLFHKEIVDNQASSTTKNSFNNRTHHPRRGYDSYHYVDYQKDFINNKIQELQIRLDDVISHSSKIKKVIEQTSHLLVEGIFNISLLVRYLNRWKVQNEDRVLRQEKIKYFEDKRRRKALLQLLYYKNKVFKGHTLVKKQQRKFWILWKGLFLFSVRKKRMMHHYIQEISHRYRYNIFYRVWYRTWGNRIRAAWDKWKSYYYPMQIVSKQSAQKYRKLLLSNSFFFLKNERIAKVFFLKKIQVFGLVQLRHRNQFKKVSNQAVSMSKQYNLSKLLMKMQTKLFWEKKQTIGMQLAKFLAKYYELLRVFVAFIPSRRSPHMRFSALRTNILKTLQHVKRQNSYYCHNSAPLNTSSSHNSGSRIRGKHSGYHYNKFNSELIYSNLVETFEENSAVDRSILPYITPYSVSADHGTSNNSNGTNYNHSAYNNTTDYDNEGYRNANYRSARSTTAGNTSPLRVSTGGFNASGNYSSPFKYNPYNKRSTDSVSRKQQLHNHMRHLHIIINNNTHSQHTRMGRIHSYMCQYEANEKLVLWKLWLKRLRRSMKCIEKAQRLYRYYRLKSAMKWLKIWRRNSILIQNKIFYAETYNYLKRLRNYTRTTRELRDLTAFASNYYCILSLKRAIRFWRLTTKNRTTRNSRRDRAFRYSYYRQLSTGFIVIKALMRRKRSLIAESPSSNRKPRNFASSSFIHSK